MIVYVDRTIEKRKESPAQPIAIGPRTPYQERPTEDRGQGKRDNQSRDFPAVAIDRPGLADMAQPERIKLGRHAFEAGQAVRPDESMEAGEDETRKRREPEPMHTD